MDDVSRYRKKPVVIEAMRFDGHNHNEIKRWMPRELGSSVFVDRGSRLCIPTLEGLLTASAGDYVIRGVQGEFYPCKPDIFDATYEEVR